MVPSRSPYTIKSIHCALARGNRTMAQVFLLVLDAKSALLMSITRDEVALHREGCPSCHRYHRHRLRLGRRRLVAQSRIRLGSWEACPGSLLHKLAVYHRGCGGGDAFEDGLGR